MRLRAAPSCVTSSPRTARAGWKTRPCWIVWSPTSLLVWPRRRDSARGGSGPRSALTMPRLRLWAGSIRSRWFGRRRMSPRSRPCRRNMIGSSRRRTPWTGCRRRWMRGWKRSTGRFRLSGRTSITRPRPGRGRGSWSFWGMTGWPGSSGVWFGPKTPSATVPPIRSRRRAGRPRRLRMVTATMNRPLLRRRRRRRVRRCPSVW
ncbi:hypothetical protein D3C72_1349310 [compost metagenome]